MASQQTRRSAIPLVVTSAIVAPTLPPQRHELADDTPPPADAGGTAGGSWLSRFMRKREATATPDDESSVVTIYEADESAPPTAPASDGEQQQPATSDGADGSQVTAIADPDVEDVTTAFSVPPSAPDLPRIAWLDGISRDTALDVSDRIALAKTLLVLNRTAAFPALARAIREDADARSGLLTAVERYLPDAPVLYAAIGELTDANDATFRIIEELSVRERIDCLKAAISAATPTAILAFRLLTDTTGPLPPMIEQDALLVEIEARNRDLADAILPHLFPYGERDA